MATLLVCGETVERISLIPIITGLYIPSLATLKLVLGSGCQTCYSIESSGTIQENPEQYAVLVLADCKILPLEQLKSPSKNAETLFSKRTLERIAQLITPEVLELVNTFDAEVSV